jgi:hypothetical protein
MVTAIGHDRCSIKAKRNRFSWRSRSDAAQKLDGGELDPFGLDELIHRYKRSAQKLWSFCGSSGSAREQAALTVEWWREHGEEEPDWWAAGEPRRRRD